MASNPLTGGIRRFCSPGRPFVDRRPSPRLRRGTAVRMQCPARNLLGEDPRMTTERDRDAEGRARNARPRDALGRPLPYGAAGEERAPEGIVRPPDRALAEAQELLDAGRPFHAHEVLEDAWKSAPEPERQLWRGLAQLAVGLTHAARGNSRGGGGGGGGGGEEDENYGKTPPQKDDAAGARRLEHRAVRSRAAARDRRPGARLLGPGAGRRRRGRPRSRCPPAATERLIPGRHPAGGAHCPT
jgi:uncharacterized protein